MDYIKKFTVYTLVSVAFAYIAHYTIIKFNQQYFGHYTHIIGIGFFSYLPFIALHNISIRFSVCFLLYLLTGALIYLPIIVIKYNPLTLWSVIIYTLFLGLMLCRNKSRALKVKGVR